MSTTLRYKVFGIGKLPPALRADVEGEGLLHLYEGVPVHFRFAGRVPGLTMAGEIRTYSGALAVTKRRALGTLSVVPRLAGRVLDVAWNAAPGEPIPGAEGSRCGGPVRVLFDEGGVHLDLDIAHLDAEWQGNLKLDFDLTFSPAELAELPRRTLEFSVPEEYVLKLLGVPHHD